MPRVWGIDESGILNEKSLTHIVEDLKIYWRLFHGPDVGLEEGDVDLQLIESVAPEVRTLWSGLQGAYLQAFISTAVGDGLEKAVEVLGLERTPASKATGAVTFTRNSPAGAGGVTIAAGSVVATVDDIKFTTDAEVTILQGQTSVTVNVTASLPGGEGNVSSGTITKIVSTVAGVDSVTNASATTGGANEESDSSLRARALNSPAVRGKATPNAIRSALRAISGVTSATVLVNNDDDTTADDSFIDDDASGAASEVIGGGTYTKVSYKFTVPTGGKWVQDLRVHTTHGASAPTARARIETDNGGTPSANLESSHLDKGSLSLTAGGDTDIHFERPGFLAAGTYHLVLEATAGEFTLQGTTTGTAGTLHVWDGASWTESTLKAADVAVIAGIPPHSVESYVTGGVAADIGETLLDVVGAGIRTWGVQSVTVKDDSDNDQVMRYNVPTTITIYVDATLVTNDDWDATNGPNAVRDALVAYLGGTDTGGKLHSGLDTGEDVLRAEIIAAIMDVTGVKNITDLKVDKVDPPVATTGDIAIAATEVARAQTAADIGVTV